MTTLDSIRLLMHYIKDEGVSNSYKIIDGQLVNLHHGWKIQYPKAYTTEEELTSVFDILVQIYANEMLVSKKLVKSAFKKT